MAFTDQEKQLIVYGKANGKSEQEVQQALVRLRTGQPVKPVATSKPPEPGIVDRVGADIQSAGGKVSDAITGTGDYAGRSTVGKAVGAVGEAFGAVPKVASEVLPQPVRAGLDTAGKAVGGIVQWLGDKIGDTKVAQDFVTKHPDAAKTLEEFAKTAVSGSEIAGTALGTEGGIGTAAKVGNVAKSGITNAYDGISHLLEHANPIEAIKNLKPSAEGGLIEKIRAKSATGDAPLMGEGNVSKQVQTSAKRLAQDAPLIGAGAAREAKPLDMYNEFINQQEKHMGDIKQDPAISMVGSEIGDAFQKVVKTRQQVGKTMASELEKTATKPVDTKSAFGNFQSDLLDNGAHFDAVNKELVTGNESKFAAPDRKILEKYASELQSLGSKPTMKQVDAFVSRMPKEIEGLKASANITFKTNAERLISKNLSDLRDSLNESGTPEYTKARSAYSNLSNFINEGAKHLGKITQSGDFARDASLAKSAVQSVLNNGKKDLLIKLEGLTGYPALDRATLALQAMKDSGDFKGNSLLDMLTEHAGTNVPLSPSGIPGKILGWAANTAKSAVTGSKVDQTRAFLKSLGDDPKGKAGEPSTLSTKDLVANANSYQPHFQIAVDRIASSGGWTVKHGPVKTAERLDQKIAQEGGSADRMRDANRATIMVQDSSDLANVLSSVKNQFGNVTRVKDKFDKPGYKSAIINVKTPLGHEAEIAVTTPQMWQARMKLGGDALYKQVRIKAQGWEAAERKMHELYEAASKR